MGIDTSAVLVVGLPLSQLPENFDYHEYEDVMARVPPYFDAPCEECLFGICVASTCDCASSELQDGLSSLVKYVESAYEEFRIITGLEGKLYLTPCVT